MDGREKRRMSDGRKKQRKLRAKIPYVWKIENRERGERGEMRK